MILQFKERVSPHEDSFTDRWEWTADSAVMAVGDRAVQLLSVRIIREQTTAIRRYMSNDGIAYDPGPIYDTLVAMVADDGSFFNAFVRGARATSIDGVPCDLWPRTYNRGAIAMRGHVETGAK